MEAPPPANIHSELVRDAWGSSDVKRTLSDEQYAMIGRVVNAWNNGHGFLVADDVGVGKTREFAGAILEAIERGSKRLVYVTKNQQTLSDALAEFKAVAGGKFPARIVNLREHKKKDGKLPSPEGDEPILYVFTSGSSNKIPRWIDQLVEVGADALFADEAHIFKNVNGSGIGRAWVILHQAMLKNPEALFMYGTATPGVTLEDFTYLYGLKEWAIGSFDQWVAWKMGRGEKPEVGDYSGDVDFAKLGGKTKIDALETTISAAVTEQIIRELKGAGKFMARDLWRGGVEFNVEMVDLLGESEEAQARREEYDRVAAFARRVQVAVQKFKGTDASMKYMGGDRSQLQSFLKQLLFQMRLPTVIEMAKREIAAGRQVVISVHNITGDDPEPGVEVIPSKRLEAAIDQVQYRIRMYDKATEQWITVKEDPVAKGEWLALREEAKKMPVLQDPLELIQQELGEDNVAFVVGKVNGKVFPASKRIANVREFQAGRKPVIVISKAGKEGISLHDTNGRQRVMLVADYEWRADTFKQELGRVDRAGQKSKPRLVLVASNLAGERKFAATIQARMASLGATSKGSAESVGVDAMEVFDSSGRTAASAMRTVVEELDELDHQYFTASAFRDLVNGKRKRMARAPAMKTFLTDLVFMPIHVSSRVMDRWIQQNQADMAGRSAIEKMLNRTGAMRGQILRVTELNQDGEPELKLYEILNENNRRYAILSGYVTEYNDRIQKTGKKTAHHYVHFTETASGAMLAGMAINLAHARRVMEEFGADVPPSDVDSAWQTLMAMDPVEVRGDLVTPQSDEIWTLKAARSRQYIAIMTGDGSEESAIAVRTKLLEEGIIEPKDGFTGRHRSQQVYWMPATKAVLEDFLERYPLAHTGQQASDFEIDGGRSSEYESPMGGFSGTPDPASQRGLHRKKRTMEATIQRNRPFPNMEVIKALADLTEIAGQRIPIRWGHISQWTAAGIYKVHPRVARIRAQWDVDTAIHEVAHALEDLLWGHPKGGPWQKKITGVAKVHQKELVDLGKALYGSRKPRGGGYKTEGFAEFIRILVSDPDVAESYAPAFYKWFQDFVLADQPALQAKLQEVTEKYRIWDQQGAVLRQRARMGRFYTPKAQVLRDFQRIRSSVTMEQLVDMAWPLRQLSKEYTMLTGKQLPPEKDPWQLMNAWRMAHASRVAYMVEQGMIDLAGQVVGRPLADVNGLVKRKDRDLFSLYLWAKRAVKLWTDPQRPRDPGMPLDDAVYIRDQLDKEFPKWRQAASIVYRWNDQLLSYVAEASPAVFGQVVKDIRRRDPGAYVPLQRWWEEMDRALMSTGVSRSGDRRSFIKKLRGSGLPVKDPFITMIAQAEKLVQAAHERAIIDAIFDLREVPGMGRLIEEVPRERIPVAARTLEQMIEEVENRLEKMGASLTIEVEEGEELDLAGEIITFFGQKQWPGTTEPIFPVYHRGKLRFYSVQPDIYRTLGALDVFRLRHDIPLVSGMLKVLEGNASIYRAGTTGLRATFGLVTNPIRDLPTLWVNTRSHKIAPVVFYYWMKSFVRVGLNQATGIDYAWFDLFKRLGGEMAQPLAADIRHTNRVARRILENRFQRIIDVRGYMDFYRDIVQAPEATPRVAELEMLATKMGWEPGMPMDLRMSIELLNAAKQVTTDFSAAGEAMRAFNRVIPFLNAQIQGPRANIRAALRESDYKGLAGKRRYQIQFAWKMLQLTALGFWLWYDNKDEEWYRELPLREKMLYWNIPFTRNDGTDELLRLPGAFEAHVVSQLPILMLDAWYRDDPEAAKEYLGILVQQFSPLELHPIPGFGGVGRIPGGMPLIDEAIQQALNRDTFWDTPIVPKRLEDYEDPDQYDDYTTRAAIYLGEKFGWSPKRIDHAMRGVVGPLASDLAALGGYGPEGTPKELFGHLSDIPLAGVLFRRGGQMGTRARSIDRFYDVLEERYTKRDRDWPGDEEPDPDFPPEPKNHRQARLAMEDAARAISMITRVANAEGRDQSQDLMREAIAIARLALETIDDGIATEAERELLRDLRRESEVRAGEAEPPTVRPPGAVGRLPRLRPDRLR